MLEELGRLDSMKRTRWEDGRVSGAVYHGGDELLDIQSNAFRRFGVSNPIHPDVFPGVRKMEAEIVAMVSQRGTQQVTSDLETLHMLNGRHRFSPCSMRRKEQPG